MHEGAERGAEHAPRDGRCHAARTREECVRADDARSLYLLWLRCFDTTAYMGCPRPECGAHWLEPLSAQRQNGATRCTRCLAPICIRCGAIATAGHRCERRRPALGGAVAGSTGALCHGRFALETMLHAGLNMLSARCTAPVLRGGKTTPCGAHVFFGDDEYGRCPQCGARPSSGGRRYRHVASTLASRLGDCGPFVPPSPSEAADAGEGAEQQARWCRGQLLRSFRQAMELSPLFREFAGRELFADAVVGAIEK